MKKTLILTLEYPPHIGGIAAYLDQFTRSVSPDDIVVLAPHIIGDAEFDATRKAHVIRKKLFFPLPLWPRWLKMFWQALWICRREEIERIHVHHILPVGYVAFLLSKITRTPYVLFSHGTDIAGIADRPWKKRMALFVAQHARRIITNSENLRSRLTSVFPQLADSISVLYPCPDKDFLTPPQEAVLAPLRHQYALEGKKVVLSVSRLVDGKGFPHLIRLMPKILQQVPNLVWFIVGDGPKRGEILKMIQEKNLQNVVRFIGEVSHDQLKAYYYLADVFALLTHPDEGREEGLGLVFLEAAAAGLPVIAGRSGGVDEAVIHGQTGLVIDFHQQPEAIIQAFADLMHNAAYAKQLGAAGKMRIQREFVWEHQLTQVQEWLSV